MVLHRLILNDFGLYGGEHVFDLTPIGDQGRTVILVQGHNGGGKTTFLEAVRLALYGKHALGQRVARYSYEDYLRRRIHAHSHDGRASIQLAFTRQEHGAMHLFDVTRSWSARGVSVIETLELTRDGEPVDDVAAEDWEHYLDDMIPWHISQLFFFDGEKIQDIADGRSVLGVREAFRTLLGLDLINQLRSDLVVYNKRRNPASTDVDMEAIDRDLAGARSELVRAEEEAAECRAERYRVQSRIAQAQKLFLDEGGTAATERAGLKKRMYEVEKQLDLLQGDLKRVAESVLPLCLAPTLIARLKDKLRNRRSYADQRAITDFLDAFAEDEKTRASKRPSWTQSHFEALRSYTIQEPNVEDLLKLDAEPDWILERLSQIDADSRRNAVVLGGELDNTYQEYLRLKAQIKGFDTDSATEALEALRSAEYALGVADTRLSEKERTIAAIRYRINGLVAERDRAIDTVFDIERSKQKVDLAERTRAALAVYEKRVLQHRVDKLSAHFIECFNQLAYKKNLFSKVRVDPETFDFSLVGKDGCEIDKGALSAGERQIFAMSMLWALGKTSGQELPMIVDTPLSQLDSVHRTAIMANYVPLAGKQMILLCTDTELTEDLDGVVAPYVARRYSVGVGAGGRGTDVVEIPLEEAHARK